MTRNCQRGGRPFGNPLFTLHKRVIEFAVVDEHAHGDGGEQNHHRNGERDNIPALERLCRIPSPFFLLAEAAQVHGVGNGLDALQRGKDQRNGDVEDVLDALSELFLFGQIQPAALLGGGDILIVPNQIRKIPQRERKSERRLVADSRSADAGGELAGVRREEKDDAERHDGSVFERLRRLV
ncbi:hypothetical protein SDC9_55680 [bioreactor metagenome]|uniref:Uncharacterized protein n=1 Tax=bioreactor metagenome TaxID=1076179 RepID=A0A644X4Y6_9ZZZZ